MRCNRIVVFLAAFLFALNGAAQIVQAPKPVDAADEGFHSLLLENEYVRVFKVEVPPFKQTQLYGHKDDFVRIALGEGKASFAEPNTMPLTREFYDGYTQFVPRGPAKVVKNEDTVRTLRMIEVELKGRRVKPPQVYDYSSAVAQMYDSIPLPVDPHASYTTSLEAYSVVGGDSQLLAGESTASHRHRGPHLVVGIAGGELENVPEGGTARRVSIESGGVAWVTALGQHTLKNVGKEPVRWITVEMK